LFSLHVPKTAGTSFRRDLEGWFGEDNMAYHYRGAQGEAPVRATTRAGLCVHGHFNRLRGIGVRQYYPEAQQFIVFLRDPFDRFVSTWRYLNFQVRSGVDVPEFADRPEFGEWLKRRRAAAEAGEDPFSFLAQLPDPIDPTRPEAAFDEGFPGVGVTERYAQSLRAIASALGHAEPAQTTRLNLATDPHRADDARGDYSAWRAEYERAFPLEYAVYAAAAARLDAGLAALGS
jgi:hypothetical protein